VVPPVNPSTPVSAETLAALARYDTPTICNAIELFDVVPRNSGYMDASIKACFPEFPPMVGFALTSTFRSMASPPKGDVYGSLTQQVEAFERLPGPAVVVFQDLDQPCVAATFGEVMCSTYKGFGARGIITSGAGRDLDQVRAIGFPAFTAGTICSHAYCHILQVGIPVTVGGMWVETGALLHGDCNGVASIPSEIASEVPEACAELARAEQIVLDYVRGPKPTAAGLSEARQASAANMAELSRRLRRKS
jgi:regulator of RNase E activity RraA